MSALAIRRRHSHRFILRFSFAFLDLVQGWCARARERRMLLQLDERMLKDIGVSRADVVQEAGKPFWRG